MKASNTKKLEIEFWKHVHDEKKLLVARPLTALCMVQRSIALPDMHSGYGFAIGNVAAFDMDDPEAVVSPGGVGFDINCGVRLIRTNLVSSRTKQILEPIRMWSAIPRYLVLRGSRCTDF